MPKIAAVIVAAGRGTRAGSPSLRPKQYREIGGEPVLSHTLRAILRVPSIGSVVVVTHPEDAALFEDCSGRHDRQRLERVDGGASRQESVRLGLLALRKAEPDIVIIHDAARPFVDTALIERVVAAVDPRSGALPALAVADTLKKTAQGVVTGTVDRTSLYAAQTPQGFPFAAILEAHEQAAAAGRADFTDDVAVAEWAGLPVRIVEGSAANTKLTTAADLIAAKERHLEGNAQVDPRTGNGYDVHRLVPGDHVWLCGVKIAHDQTLDGHSDADVGLHALTDALLATCGAGDIGDHFPPSDPQWKGASSDIFVRHAAAVVRQKGGRIANADVTLICEAPKIAAHRGAMREAMADMLGIALDRVSVKATTNETIGFIGRREGIAAIATASVVYPGDPS
ncbi:bifunctional 2-C-methyl-D-erythritol 4-phosphate cytidylyltransferase/2-C-methyl-D-erythritol 2,4-cyclodiphosphate synthase [Aureimonas mangrovi]|uniref:bifunctional 2-C-methyl-D-erythritol 4-phosphate cytidylyltransferase/2-C-methyl-D-erythritol 2,4-cyclodiphosphate synthase n=1 Tax=Aureimonas mangrovi TaxID=2758041 RepID=UPI00163D5679|nr:bifunctional 2-C-methyl-D-erythritol 4-phosphate cytidylyltransferase/2-C-methyl-D-erythritol 2,4-cyclodiphosphate synthase [Aureimonas mangrovi]